MNTEDHTRAVADRARGLTDALNRLSDRLDEVKKDSETRDEELTRHSRRNRIMIWITIVSLALDILLTAGFAVVAVQAHNANAAAAANRQTQLALCQSANVARAQQIELWEYVIGLSGQKPQTPQQQKVTQAFKAHLLTLFRPRDCAHPNPERP